MFAVKNQDFNAKIIASNFHSNIGIEINKTESKAFLKVSSLICSMCSGVADPTSFTGGLEIVGGGGAGLGLGL